MQCVQHNPKLLDIQRNRKTGSNPTEKSINRDQPEITKRGELVAGVYDVSGYITWDHCSIMNEMKEWTSIPVRF